MQPSSRLIRGVPRQHASPQEFKARAPVHLTLDHFEPVDVALDRPVAPPTGDGLLNGRQVALQHPRKLRQEMKSDETAAFSHAASRVAFRRRSMARNRRAIRRRARALGNNWRKASTWRFCSADRRSGLRSSDAIRPEE